MFFFKVKHALLYPFDSAARGGHINGHTLAMPLVLQKIYTSIHTYTYFSREKEIIEEDPRHGFQDTRIQFRNHVTHFKTPKSRWKEKKKLNTNLGVYKICLHPLTSS